MKCSSISKIIGTLLLLVFCFANSSVFAHTPLAREIHGVVQLIDYQKKTLTLADVQERGPQKLIWITDTQFLRDLETVPATELKQGSHVTVYYHTPFFGKPFAVKIILVNGN
jgi:hypothetical protein